MNAHRAALDHVMTVVADSAWAELLVLRGSMTMPAWVGAAARPPGDLDWVLRAPDVVPLDDLDPYPYLDSLVPAQQWPEAVHGAVRNEMWELEEFDTGGRHPRLPPEGLNWVPGCGLGSPLDLSWEDEFSKLIRRRPRAPDGVEFDPEKVAFSADWDYTDADSDYADDPGIESGRIRLGLPWRSPDGDQGEARVDLSFGERLPDPPVCTAVPRFGDLPPVGLWTATRELSLAWKLHWLAADQQTQGVSASKDVYDAVLLAELDGMHLRPGLRRLALGAGLLLDPAGIRRWSVSGAMPGGDDHARWLARLAEAVTRLL